jgi:site-specific DNA-cytosine methylase
MVRERGCYLIQLPDARPRLAPVNAPNARTKGAYITALSEDHLDNLPPIDVVVACWPCQGLSRANRASAGQADRRSGLLYDVIRIIRYLKQTNPHLQIT